ncbi:molybdopterin-dependent oxidoreductase [Actinoplanes sp. NPDC051411]|uniref:molybdopterin-dependent oxidoreductase n=1 Tax=Actinoplanes sp. NPDC051411 TaxID=3155522 RepID=UPI003419C175
MTDRWKAAAAGVLAAASGVAVAELFAAATRPGAAPLIAVGGAVIDATPTPVKEFAVRELGTNDKPALLAGIGLALAVFAAAVGIAALWRRFLLPAGVAVLAAAGAAAALSRPTATAFDAVPALLAAVSAGALLHWLLRRLSPAGGQPRLKAAEESRSPQDTRPRLKPAADRRAFLRAAALVAGGAIVAEAGAQFVTRSRGGAAGKSRAAIKLPAATDPAKPLPGGAGPGFTTPAGAFYRVDTALTVPRIDPSAWRLRIHGMVGHEVKLSFDDLLKRPLIERDITLNCVSNEVGGPYIGTARWLGVPLGPLLRELGVEPRADQIVARSTEGMTIGTPVTTALDGRDTMLVVGMNGAPLPLEHGFPVRMLTPGLYGYAGACKWLDEIELTRFDRFDAYWVKRGWARAGPVRTASRVDRPKPFARLNPGDTTVAGVAWAQRRGIRAVEVSVDDGPWQRAELLPVPSTDTWVQWRYTWRATKGPHSIKVRATDGTGAVQTGARATPFPSGATGWHTITVTVG